MADEIKLTQEELDSIFPPADPAKYDAWFDYQVELGEREADDPNAVSIPHEEVVRDLRERLKVWQARAAERKNVA